MALRAFASILVFISLLTKQVAFAHDTNVSINNAIIHSVDADGYRITLAVTGIGSVATQSCPTPECYKTEAFFVSHAKIDKARTSASRDWTGWSNRIKEVQKSGQRVEIGCLVMDLDKNIVRDSGNVKAIHCDDMAVRAITNDGSGQKIEK